MPGPAVNPPCATQRKINGIVLPLFACSYKKIIYGDYGFKKIKILKKIIYYV
jgi:hypothetical protein